MITSSLRSVTIRIVCAVIFTVGFSVLGGLVVHEAVGASLIAFVQRHPDLSIETRLENTDLAVRFSSRNPGIHWLRGGAYFGAANQGAPESADEQWKTALDELRMAAQMSPQDYRVWLS